MTTDVQLRFPWDQALPSRGPDWEIPKIENPRAIAIEHVRALLARGYNEDRADEDYWAGDGKLHGGPTGGCEVKHGKIRIPLFGRSRFVFNFRELAEEIRANTSSELTTDR